MKTQSIKMAICAALLSLLMVGCSSTSTTGSGGTETLPSDAVSTGTIGDSGVNGSGAGAAGDMASIADTVFYFDFDKSILKPESRAALRLHAQALKNNSRQIRLQGHGDERGTREYNMALGERRGYAVKEFLVMEGVSSSQMEVISYGEESPAALASDETSYALNRRVEMQ